MALDIGAVRIGVALASSDVRIAVPHQTVRMDEKNFAATISEMVEQNSIDVLVVGYPRNQSGEPTAQTAFIEKMAAQIGPEITTVFQDESLTSVMAEQRLAGKKNGHSKGDVDAEAAAIILQDYMEMHL